MDTHMVREVYAIGNILALRNFNDVNNSSKAFCLKENYSNVDLVCG